MPAAWHCGRICLGPQCFPQLWLVLLLFVVLVFPFLGVQLTKNLLHRQQLTLKIWETSIPFPRSSCSRVALVSSWCFTKSPISTTPNFRTSDSNCADLSGKFPTHRFERPCSQKKSLGFFRSDGEDAEGVLQGGCKTRPGSDLEAQGPQGPIKDYYYFHKCLCQLRTSWHADLFTNWLMGLLRRSSQSRTSMLEDFSLTRQLAPMSAVFHVVSTWNMTTSQSLILDCHKTSTEMATTLPSNKLSRWWTVWNCITKRKLQTTANVARLAHGANVIGLCPQDLSTEMANLATTLRSNKLIAKALRISCNNLCWHWFLLCVTEERHWFWTIWSEVLNEKDSGASLDRLETIHGFTTMPFLAGMNSAKLMGSPSPQRLQKECRF